jgi:hypothetical protein
MNKIYLLILVIFVTCFVACKKDRLKDGSAESTEVFANDDSHGSKIYFAKTLAAALEKEPALRTFIKEEALKMFDKDYDVFYQLVSGKKLDDGQTFYEKLSRYASSKDSLNEAIEKLPLLTILVPELPNFDAKSWKEGEIPSVAVEPLNAVGDDIKAFYGQDGSFEVPNGLVPCFPILVVKENERVEISKGGNRYAKVSTSNKVMSLKGNVKTRDTSTESQEFLNIKGTSFTFVNKVFNGLNSTKNLPERLITLSSDRGRDSRGGENGGSGDRGGTSGDPRPGQDGYVPPNERRVPLSKVQHIVDAINSSAEWPRDFIYYGIDPRNGKNSGPLNRKVVECITSMRFADGAAGYNAITTPEDTKPADNTQVNQQWTEGQYEFRITGLINKKNGPGEQTEKIIYASGSDLFEIYYDYTTPARDRINCRACPPITYAKPRIGYAKIFQFPIPIEVDSWDLDQSSFGWKFYVIKFNNQTTYTETKKNTVEFATNFELSATLGDKIKIGPKFGASTKTTNTQEYTISRVVGSSTLGDANIYFDKPIWTKYNIYEGYESYDGTGRNRRGIGPLMNMVNYEPYEIFTGAVYLTIEPRLEE